MQHKTIIECISRLQNEGKSSKKEAILSEYKNNDNIKKYLYYCYNEVDFIFNKSKLPKLNNLKKNINRDKNQLEDMYCLLDSMNNGLRGKAADDAIIKFLESSDDEFQDLLHYMLKRNIKAKVSHKMINKVFPNLIPVAPYMRCEGEKMMSKRIVFETDGIKHGALIQTKADGLFNNMTIEADGVKSTTRYGRLVPECILTKSLLFSQKWIGYTIHGEFLVVDDKGKIMPREIGNGKLNAFFKQEETRNTILEELNNTNITERKKKTLENKLKEHELDWEHTEKNSILKVWDIVKTDDWKSLESKVTCIDRFNLVQEFVKEYQSFYGFDNSNSRVQLIDWKIVHSLDEAMEFYNDQLKKGEEGAVVKNLNSYWCHDENRTGVIKLKEFKECDLICTGWNYGEPGGEFENGIGSLICESSDGKIKVDVSGLKRHQRGFQRVDINDSSKGIELIPEFDLDQYIGKIVTVKYSYVIGDSLYLPSLIEIRDHSDKNFPDSSEKIKKGK